jgi:hypothetical protein
MIAAEQQAEFIESLYRYATRVAMPQQGVIYCPENSSYKVQTREKNDGDRNSRRASKSLSTSPLGP